LMDKECEKSPPGAKSLIYLPYLMGERTPHLDDDAKGVFFGLTPSHTKADFIRSVMEGVAFAMNDCLNIIKETGVPVQEIRASGGGGRSKIWKSIQANVYKSDVKTVNATEGPALGVALLAGVGVGIYKSVEEACDAVIKIKEVQKPDLSTQRIYEGYYDLFRSLYRSLKEDYKKLSGLL
jgi:xylulokinase